MSTYELKNQKNIPIISLEGTGNKLKNLRVEHGLTREELGNELNCSYQAVANWENGRKTPSLDKCVALSNLYKCHIEDLLELDFFDNTPIEVHEEEIAYSVNNKLISHPSQFKKYINSKVILKDGKPANGIYIISSYILNFVKGYLSDQQTQSGKILKPAVYSSDNKYTEHWKDGFLHCENGPAVIDGTNHYEEWWLNGKQIEPKIKE